MKLSVATIATLFSGLAVAVPPPTEGVPAPFEDGSVDMWAVTKLMLEKHPVQEKPLQKRCDREWYDTCTSSCYAPANCWGCSFGCTIGCCTSSSCC